MRIPIFNELTLSDETAAGLLKDVELKRIPLTEDRDRDELVYAFDAKSEMRLLFSLTRDARALLIAGEHDTVITTVCRQLAWILIKQIRSIYPDGMYSTSYVLERANYKHVQFAFDLPGVGRKSYLSTFRLH